MANDVYADGNAIACKAGDGKVIAAFPDVCLSPPSPPAGPIPVPYPDTSFSKDMQKGSKTVLINGKEVMLKDKSFYKTSPLGNEAATRSFGASVITHVITGKTYFNAWSMDVKFEGENVDRHVDLTTSNHASYPGGPPMTNAEKLAKKRVDAGKCPCCGKSDHVGPSGPTPAATGTPMPADQWYKTNLARKFPNPTQRAAKEVELNTLLADVAARPDPCPNCITPPKGKVMPESPCNVFFDPPSSARTTAANQSWREKKKTSTYQERHGILTGRDWEARTKARLKKKLGRDPTTGPPPIIDEVKEDRQVNHLTPKVAGGCPTDSKNLQPMRKLCEPCKSLDRRFNEFQ